MARRHRIQTHGATYHAGTRGIRRMPVFLGDDDRQLFLAILADVVERFEWRCQAYCLMGNHYHLALRTPEANIGAGMHRLNGLYAQAFNRRHGFNGHLFEDRYWSTLAETDADVFRITRYVVLNPIRAGMCALPHQWPWSSYRATAGLDARPAFLDLGWLGEWGRDRYRSYVLEGLEQPVAAPTIAVTSPSQR
ncbi:MAG TPA: transposase [Gaiellales bacterium]|jgi:REP element-mobilizing transposase RayT|nr:transposase [Gaiellales bacterium]